MSSQVKGQVGGFGDTLKRLMRERKIGVDTLASQTHISARLIGKYRAGTTVPRDPFGDPSENAHKLADALGVSITDLLPDEAERNAA